MSWQRRRILTAAKRNGSGVYHYSRIPHNGKYHIARLSDDPIEAQREAVELELKLKSNSDYVKLIEAMLRQLICQGRQRAKSRRAFEIDYAWAKEKAAAQGYRCSETGIMFTFTLHGSRKFERAFAPSLDRIDSSKGYTKDNTRIVCRVVNFAANSWGIDVVRVMAAGMRKTEKEHPCKLAANYAENHGTPIQQNQPLESDLILTLHQGDWVLSS